MKDSDRKILTECARWAWVHRDMWHSESSESTCEHGRQRTGEECRVYSTYLRGIIAGSNSKNCSEAIRLWRDIMDVKRRVK